MTEKMVCFVIAPIGDEKTEIRRRSDRVFKHIIKPAAELCGYSALPAKDIPGSGLIMSEVINYVVSAPLVIADLTGANANVFYELALRHAVRKPVVQIIAKKEKIKFDVSQIRTMQFDIDDVIDDENRKSQTVSSLVEYIQEVMENATSTETPVSSARASIWTPFPEKEKALSSPEIHSIAKKRMDAMLQEYLETLASAEATPPEVKYLIKDLMASPRVNLLEDTGDDLDAACTLVKNVPEKGYISATSSLQHHDADERNSYRKDLNEALERYVTYRKVICSSSELSSERYVTWYEEFKEKADLIRNGIIRPDLFRLLHYPSPMSVDVLISQDANSKCLEMVAGFAGGEGHGGFSTDDERMVADWLDVYLEKKIMPGAEQHTKAVLEGAEACPCFDFLKLLDDARQAAALQPESVELEPRSE
jgi:hypothetical protein